MRELGKLFWVGEAIVWLGEGATADVGEYICCEYD